MLLIHAVGYTHQRVSDRYYILIHAVGYTHQRVRDMDLDGWL